MIVLKGFHFLLFSKTASQGLAILPSGYLFLGGDDHLMLSWVLGWLGEICCCSAVSAFQVSWHFPQTASNVVSLVRMLDIVTIICEREVPCSCLAGCRFLSVAVGNVLLTLLFTPLYFQCLSQLFLLSCTSLGLVSRVPVCHSHANLFYSFFLIEV